MILEIGDIIEHRPDRILYVMEVLISLQYTESGSAKGSETVYNLTVFNPKTKETEVMKRTQYLIDRNINERIWKIHKKSNMNQDSSVI